MKYRIPDNVAYIDAADFDLGEALYITMLPLGRSVCLEASARHIWTMAAEGRDLLVDIAEAGGQPADTIAREVALFLMDLVNRGLLTEVDENCPAD